ncbi:IS30 family transposase [Paraburkholderia xenovorans]|uniref:IS30 family transposase n=1 Tax=Paraburkholderia xenovorans TaxID=36873 RepID=UPI0038BDC189
MAQARVPGQRGLPRVTRDHLPQSLHPGPWCLEEGIAGTFAAYPGHAAFPPLHAENGRARQDPRHSVNQRTSSHSRGRAVPGHWEGDLLCGSGSSQIATLVERQTRYVMLVKIASKDSETVANALIKHACKLPQELYKSLTWDRGAETASHKRFTVATDVTVCFCDPQRLWQRGSNENTNGLLRQYFPKGTDLSVYSQAKLNAVARRLNERPRKTLNYQTPAERFNQTLHPPVESAPGHLTFTCRLRSARRRPA